MRGRPYVGFNSSAGQIEFYNERTFARVKSEGNTKFVTIEGISYDAGIDIQSPNAMIGMHIKHSRAFLCSWRG